MSHSSLAILELLSSSDEPTTYQKIAADTGLKSPKSALSKLKKKGLVCNLGKNQWALTDKGKEFLASRHGKPTGEPVAVVEEIPISLEGVFRHAGEQLYFTGAKNKARLDAIVYYVERISGFTNPISIWSALTDFNLTPRVKYTWIKLYLAIANPGERMPPELEEKRHLFLKEGEEPT